MGWQPLHKLYPNDLTLRYSVPLLLLKEYPLVFSGIENFLLLVLSVSFVLFFLLLLIS